MDYGSFINLNVKIQYQTTYVTVNQHCISDVTDAKILAELLEHQKFDGKVIFLNEFSWDLCGFTSVKLIIMGGVVFTSH